MTFKVQQRMCATCIYRAGSGMHGELERLEREVADPHMRGFFQGYRECHHAKRRSKVCCAGFWAKHKDHFTLGQIAQRLGLVERVKVDVIGRKERAK